MTARILTVLSATVFAITAIPAAAENTSPAKAAATGTPKIEFNATTYNFGKVNMGELIRHEFIFTNVGTAPLEILEVKPGCGCTTAGAWDKVVQPGKTGVIPLQFNTANYGGSVAKSTTVTCNDPGRSNLVLQINGTVWKPIDISPSMAVFQLSEESAATETKVIKITNNTDDMVTLSDLVCTNTAFRTELKTVRPGKEFEVHVTAAGPFTGRTTIAPVSVKTSAPKSPVLNFTAYAIMQPGLSVSPEQLWLPAGPTAAGVKHAVYVRNSGTNVVTLSDAAINVPGAEVRVTELQAGKVFNMQISFPEGFHVEAGKNVELTFKSTHPKYPLIKVPIRQQPASSALGKPMNRPTASTSPGRPIPSTAGVKLLPAKSAEK